MTGDQTKPSSTYTWNDAVALVRRQQRQQKRNGIYAMVIVSFFAAIVFFGAQPDDVPPFEKIMRTLTGGVFGLCCSAFTAYMIASDNGILYSPSEEDYPKHRDFWPY